MTLYQSMWRPWIRLLGACALVLLSAPVPTGAAQEMGMVYVVKSDPSNATTVFAGAQHGVFKSVDAGATWTATSLTQPAIALAIAPVTPTTVYAGTDLGLFKSTDGGTTWSTAGVSNPVFSVEIDPAIPTTLFASIGSQIIKSADGGDNWTSVGPAGAAGDVAIVAGPPLILYVGTKRFGGIDVFSSTDGGSTWTNASVSNPDPSFVPLWGLDFALTVNPTIATTAYVASSGYRCDGDGCFTIGTISQSTDGGPTWFTVDQVLGYYGSWVWPQIGVSQVVVDPLQSNIFYAAWNVFCDQQDPFCAGFGVVSDAWISKYGGATGPRISNLSAWALWFDLLNPTLLYAATASGVLQSTDGGVTWNTPGAPGLTSLTLQPTSVLGGRTSN